MHSGKLPQDNGERMENEILLKEIIMDLLTCSMEELVHLKKKLARQPEFRRMNTSSKAFCQKIIDAVIRQKEGVLV